MVTGAKVDSSE